MWQKRARFWLLALVGFSAMLAAFRPAEVIVGEPAQSVSAGQALAYKIGQLKIQELRTRASRELGPKFDLREFREVVLKNGTVPLDILDRQVEDWIAAKKGR